MGQAVTAQAVGLGYELHERWIVVDSQQVRDDSVFQRFQKGNGGGGALTFLGNV